MFVSVQSQLTAMKIILQKIRIACIICCFLFLLLTGCVPRVGVLTDTYSDAVELPRGFECQSTFAVIEPSSLDASYSQNVLLDKEVRYKIEKILMNQGYRVTHPEASNYLVYFFYGIDFDTKLALSPFYIPGKTIYTEGNAGIFGPGGYGYSRFSKTTTTSGSIDWVPIEVANNTRWLAIKVVKKEKAKKGDALPIWNGSSMSVGQSGDVRNIINYLLASNFQYFGKSTHQQIYHSISLNDGFIDWLKNSN